MISMHINESQDIRIPPSTAIQLFCRSVLLASRFMHMTLTTNKETTVEGMHLIKISVSFFSRKNHADRGDVHIFVWFSFIIIISSKRKGSLTKHKTTLQMFYFVILYSNFSVNTRCFDGILRLKFIKKEKFLRYCWKTWFHRVSGCFDNGFTPHLHQFMPTRIKSLR